MKNDNAESEMKFKKEQFLNGIGVSSEIAIGTAHVIQSGLGQLPEYEIVENNIKNEKTPKQIEQKNEFKTSIEQNKNNLDTNSIDQKAQQFAEFFNGEIVNLE